MSAIEIEPSLDIRAENNPLKGPTETKQLTLSPQQLAMVMIIAQYPVFLVSARLGSSVPEAVAWEMPLQSPPVSIRANFNPEVGYNNLSIRRERGTERWKSHRGSGRSRRRECEECSRGSTKEHACKRNMLSALRLPIFWWRTKPKPI